MKRAGLCLAAAALLAAACVPEDPFPGGDGGGKVCFSDSDCAPNGCCGRGTAAVHVTDAPSCQAVACDAGCPKNQVDCGCGIPVCRDQRCIVARTFGPGCP